MKTPITPLYGLTIALLTSAALLPQAHAALLAFDDFSTYTEGEAVNGKDGGGALTGFGSTTWTANAAVQVNSGALNQGADLQRSIRAFSSTPLASTGTIYIRTNLALSNAAFDVNFSALELATTFNSDADSIRFSGNSSGLNVNVVGAGGTSSAIIDANDGLNHEWLVELNLDTGAGQAWIDPNTATFDPNMGGTAFTAPSAFALNWLNVGTFAASSSLEMDDFQIGMTLADVGVTAVVPEPSSTALLGLGGLALMLRRRR